MGHRLHRARPCTEMRRAIMKRGFRRQAPKDGAKAAPRLLTSIWTSIARSKEGPALRPGLMKAAHHLPRWQTTSGGLGLPQTSSAACQANPIASAYRRDQVCYDALEVGPRGRYVSEAQWTCYFETLLARRWYSVPWRCLQVESSVASGS